MTPQFFLDRALVPALSLLPSNMDTPNARAEVLAICMQESGLKYRRQVGGPARSYAQFEMGGGVRGVLTHPASQPHIQRVLASLDYDPNADAPTCFAAMEHNDILCAAFTRLLLYTLPGQLPAEDQPEEGWKMYVAAWRPGKPRRASWNAYYTLAWDLV